jgi:hypothetical protein
MSEAGVAWPGGPAEAPARPPVLRTRERFMGIASSSRCRCSSPRAWASSAPPAWEERAGAQPEDVGGPGSGTEAGLPARPSHPCASRHARGPPKLSAGRRPWSSRSP